MNLFTPPLSYWKRGLVMLGTFFVMTFIAALLFRFVITLGRNPLIGQALATVVIFGGTAFVYCWLMDKKEEVREVCRQKFSWKWLLAVVLMVIAASSVMDYISTESDYNENIKSLITDVSYWGLVKMIVALALLPAIFEEIFFRGVLQKFLIRWTRSALAGIVIAAAIFSLVHGDMANFVPRFLLGLILGLLYQYSNRLWTNMMFHFLNNTIAAFIIWALLRGDIISEQLNFHWVFAILALLYITVFVVYNELKNTRSIRNNSLELENSRLSTSFRNFKEKEL